MFFSSGAGSCLEALGAGKPLLVVVNDKLMGNHQLELARQLHMDSHLLYCTCRYVFLTCTVCTCEVIQKIKSNELFLIFQHPDRNTEDHGSICSSALLAWTAEAFCKLSRQSSQCLVELKLYRTVYCDCKVFLYAIIIYVLVINPCLCCELFVSLF